MTETQDTLLLTQNTPPTHYTPLTELSLLIMVGLTGAGKTTTLIALYKVGLVYSILPNRREVTDQIIITSLQQATGQPLQPVNDRIERFRYTAEYRAQNPGGMSHALSCLAVKSKDLDSRLIFDGLRGLEEVEYAASYFPLARFIILDAPDMVRLSRLLTRGDSFDQGGAPINDMVSNDSLRHELAKIADIEAIFSPMQLNQIAHLPQTHQLEPVNIIKQTKVIVEERRNYDSHAAKDYLSQNLPAERVLLVDTAAHPPNEVATQMMRWL